MKSIQAGRGIASGQTECSLFQKNKDMKKLIPEFPAGVYVLAIWEQMDEEQHHWHVYLFNGTEHSLENALITASGYGEYNGDDVRTSVIRYSLGEVSSFTAKRVEPIYENVLGLYNQYWVSFSLGGVMYDRKFLFPPFSIMQRNVKEIPDLMTSGIYAS